jgi:iron complex outermembrane receptor protein
MNKVRYFGSTAMSVMCLALASQAHAQEQSTSGSVFEDELIVTAEKREENLQNVGVSVTAFSGANLEALGVTDTDDLAGLIPAVNIQSAGGTDLQLVVNIRGVSQNDFGDHNEPPVAVYVDEGYVSWLGAVGMPAYDLERVEALRGPQGTLFGRNATGGLIHFITRTPSQDFDAYLTGEYSSNSSYRLEGAVGGGVADGLSLRLSSAFASVGEYVENRAGPDLGNAESFDIRAQALIEPTESAEILLRAGYSRLEGGGSTWTHRAAAGDPANFGLGRFIADNEDFYGTCAGCDALGYRDADGDVDAVDLNDRSFMDRDIINGQARVELDLGGVTLTSISDYRAVERLYGDDADGGPLSLTAFEQNIDDASQFSQELRLSGENDVLEWILGVYYLKIDGDYSSNINIDPALTGSGSPTFDFIHNSWTLKTESYAYFGQAELDLSDELSFSAGFRWTEDEKEFEYANTDSLGGGVLGGGLIFNQATVGDLASRSEGDYSYMARLEWQPNSDILFYAGVSRGNKAGGFTASLDGFIAANEVNYEAEVLTNYEAGIKTTWFDGRLRLNGSAFFYDYNDYQAFLFEGFTSKIINVDAEIYGGELEMIATPRDGLDIVMGVSLLETEAQNVPMPNGAFANRELPQSPGLSFNALVRQNFSLGASGDLAVQADFNCPSSDDLRQRSVFGSEALAHLV